ncbi:alpha/beta hydrolase family esterase [Sphingomonas hylomeconis]|uniref:Alpha/beta hydrolase family esterase n=1 Tax=Sphingomonas hylomeconis TaxID=1395958 RepID=A0ABV7T0N2_9SPHN|nr:PHB depolymerase family esterase [Sphingomonas hylomeconis]
MLLFRLLIALAMCAVAGTANAECRTGALDALPERAFYVPTTPVASMPLVILLHGSTSTGAEMLRDSDLATTAQRHGFVVIAPNGGITAGRGYVWNIPGVPTVTGALPGKHARNDVAYLIALVDQLVASGCVDGKRVYVTGLSGGGRMTSWLGCVAARRFAAIAPVVGLRAGRPLDANPTRADPATCHPRASVPVLAFSGDADATNPIAGGGAPYWQYSQSAAVQRWAAINGCAEPYTRNISATVYEQGYARCRGNATAAARVMRGGQHSWSVVDNEALWAFLSQYSR